MTEYHHRVARQYLCITIDQNTFIIANQTTDGDTKRQTEILHRFLGNLRTFCCRKFSHIRINHHQGAHIADIGIKHHLIDMAGSNGLLIDYRTDIQTLCHFNIVKILDHGNGLSHTQSLGCQTSQDIGLSITRQRHESLRILNTFLLQQTKVTRITMDYHRIGITEQFVQLFTTPLTLLDNLQVHIVRQCQPNSDCRLATTHDDDILDIGIVFLTRNLTDIRNILARSHEISEVVHMQLVVTTGNQCLTVTFDSHDMVRVVRTAKILQRLVEYLAGLT